MKYMSSISERLARAAGTNFIAEGVANDNVAGISG